MMSTRLSKVTLAGMTALMLAGFTATAHGFTGAGSSVAGERQIQVRGKVVCTGCRLQEVRRIAKYKNTNRLYQLILSGRQLVVIELEAVNNPGWVNNAVVPHLWVRGVEAQLQKLRAPETVTQQVEISGVVTGSNMISVTEVTVQQEAETQKIAHQ